MKLNLTVKFTNSSQLYLKKKVLKKLLAIITKSIKLPAKLRVNLNKFQSSL